MEFENNNETAKSADQQVSASMAPPVQHQHRMIGILLILVAALVLVGGVAALLAAGDSDKPKTSVTNQEQSINTKGYQALFLTNGQVYFGKLANVDANYVTMRDIYYLQVQQSVQPAANNKESQVSLAKLGQELHGPEDKMYISQDQILFWENLKSDSKVVEAITKHKKQ